MSIGNGVNCGVAGDLQGAMDVIFVDTFDDIESDAGQHGRCCERSAIKDSAKMVSPDVGQGDKNDDRRCNTIALAVANRIEVKAPYCHDDIRDGDGWPQELEDDCLPNRRFRGAIKQKVFRGIDTNRANGTKISRMGRAKDSMKPGLVRYTIIDKAICHIALNHRQMQIPKQKPMNPVDGR